MFAGAMMHPLRLLGGALVAVALLFVQHRAAVAAPLAFEEIADGVYVHHGQVAQTTPDNQGDIANLGFIVGENAVAMIDSGGSVEVGKAALEAIRAVTDKPVRWLVNTHMHPDHVFGDQVFKAAGATIVAHRREPAALAARAEHYAQSMREQLGAKHAGEVEIIYPDETVERHVVDRPRASADPPRKPGARPTPTTT